MSPPINFSKIYKCLGRKVMPKWYFLPFLSLWDLTSTNPVCLCSSQIYSGVLVSFFLFLFSAILVVLKERFDLIQLVS